MHSSDSDEDNDIRYGTPLDPFDEDEVPSKRKYQQPPDQYAVDAHGRRRFHGAFTGGFSAGFGNTVGTQEGWIPTAFKSSRSEKANTISQRAEDFMDEEDRNEFGIAPRHMQTQSEFSGQKRPRQRQFYDGPIPGEPVLEQLVRAVHETAAVRILRAMGWREGQGAGDRVSREEKKRAKAQHRVYGCYMPAEMKANTEAQFADESSDSEFDYDDLFAPDDYEPYILHRKNDRFGLGYSGLSRHSVLGNLVGEYGSQASTSKSHLLMKDKGKKVSIRGQAFGVGALEAEDEDIYATEDMSHYDFTLGGATSNKPVKTSAKEKGANVLEGFVKAVKGLPSVPNYPPPALPRDYTPAAAGSRRSRFEPTTHTQRDQGLGRHELTAEARGELLGETPIPKTVQKEKEAKPPSNIEDTIAKLIGRNVNFTTSSEGNSHEADYISIKDTGKEITKVFKPFASNPLKQTRYEKYLSDKDTVGIGEDGKIDKLSEWEKQRELMEFEQAAKLYRPLTGVMGDRFTHASEPDDGALNPLCAVAKSSMNYGLATPDQIEAAKQGLYGVMTRKEEQWRPEALVCKRFNVPEPGGARLEPAKEDKPKVSYSIFSYMESSVHDKESFSKEQSKFSGSKSLHRDSLQNNDKNNQKIKQHNTSNDKCDIDTTKTETKTGFRKRMTVSELFLKESEKALQTKEVEVTETISKFDKMDLYKSIFLSDSDTDDEQENKQTKTGTVSDFVDVPKNVERNFSPPRGIFANIDFDELNSWKRNVDGKKVDTKLTEPVNTETLVNKGDNSNVKKLETEIYGPKIPENLKNRLEDLPDKETVKDNNNFKPKFRSKDERDKEVEEIISSSSDSWVDIKEVKKKHKKKKAKKSKSRHKKSKHKKKDK